MRDDIDLLVVGDVVSSLVDKDNLFSAIGFSAGEVERFLSSWGDALQHSVPVSRPRGVLFAITPGHEPQRRLEVSSIRKLWENLSKAQQDAHVLTIRLDGSMTSKAQLGAEIRRALSGGQWTQEQGSQMSAGYFKGKCVFLSIGVSLQVFIDGVIVFNYVDARDRTLQAAEDLYRMQGWVDGELLVKCGAEDLGDRTRRGIWHYPDAHVLRTRPEELIQSRLRDYLKQHLSGFDNMTLEYHLEKEGRIDVVVFMADRMVYVVEIKWIGRSIKEAHAHLEEKTLKASLKKWACKEVMALDEKNAQKGVAQLSQYLTQFRAAKGYLVVYDCRPHGIAKGSEAASAYPVPSDLKPHQYKICHVPVDPRTPSKKSKD